MKPISFIRTACAGILFAAPALFGQYTAVDITPTSPAGNFTVTSGPPGRQAGSYYDNIQIPFASPHAMVLNGGVAVDLHPTSLPPDSPYFGVPGALTNTRSRVFSTDGITQVGDFINTAVLWTGTPDSMINLHPPGYTNSAALATNGGQQAGWATTTASNGGHRGVQQTFNVQHAILWRGSAANFTDLHIPNFDGSIATSLNGAFQGGYAINASNGQTQALLWAGSAASVINLHPQIYTSSNVNGVWMNGTAVGVGTVVKSGKAITSTDHAVLWFGSAKNFVDLNPAGYTMSRALSLNAVNQVGWGTINAHDHAIVWSGTAASAVDLNQFLPAGFTDAMAVEIDAAGNILANALGSDGVWHPVVFLVQ
jgi:hypothetical protein